MPAYSSDVNLGVMYLYACIEELFRLLVLLIFFFSHVQARLLLSFNLISSVERAHYLKFVLHFDGVLNAIVLRIHVNRRKRQMF